MSLLLNKFFNNIEFMKDFSTRLNNLKYFTEIIEPKKIQNIEDLDLLRKEYYQIIFFKRNWCLIEIRKDENTVFYSDKTLSKFFDNFNKHLIKDVENIFFIRLTFILIKMLIKSDDNFYFRDYISKLLYFMQIPINNFEKLSLKNDLDVYPKEIIELNDFFKKY